MAVRSVWVLCMGAWLEARRSFCLSEYMTDVGSVTVAHDFMTCVVPNPLLLSHVLKT